MVNPEDPIEAAYLVLERAKLVLEGEVIGTVAACDPEIVAANYQECFIRDFVPSALVLLMDGDTETVKRFLKTVLNLRHQQQVMEGHERALGLLPASFKLSNNKNEPLQADFGDRAIGRVAPVDSALWWMILLRAYTLASDDYEFAHCKACQDGIVQILELYLKESFETSPAMLVPDASFMIDRRMGVYGHPLEIQALFYGMLTTARELLRPTKKNERLLNMVSTRLSTLRSYVRIYYWLDGQRLNEIHRMKTEEFGHQISNVLNIYPEIIPDWIDGWLGEGTGYLVGNLGAGRIDFRFFSFGNLLSIIFGLATTEEGVRIMQLFEEHWEELIGDMPLKIVYPAEQGERWAWVTGKDPKNAPWSYHNGGSWPCLLWAFVAAAIQTGRTDLAERAYHTAMNRVHKDRWPEYYDGKKGSLIGRRSNFYQTWTAASVILSHRFIKNPDSFVSFQSLMFGQSLD
ncbi:MAG: glycoside hydrolase 100 family protein [Gammaproteobacteria bacterium]|nr:glycoside hydrolase 100 family protein [Gammaproteobacteria bacterium]MDH5694106.1 glycoside hydrolase 100 family protein [Gammaproteobacteria bacterium]